MWSRSTGIATWFTTLRYEYLRAGACHWGLRETFWRSVCQWSSTHKAETVGLSIRPTCQVNTGLPSTTTTMDITENTLTRSDAHLIDYLNITWIYVVANGHIIANSCRVLPVDFVGIMVYAFVFLEVEALTCVVFYAILFEILDWTMSSCMNLYVRWWTWNKWLKRI